MIGCSDRPGRGSSVMRERFAPVIKLPRCCSMGGSRSDQKPDDPGWSKAA
jgi:hypothetical protein